jgi:exopolyphosphatase/guanosine-5'-triphosphate,3'-diphosphate pyrophosphatase
VQLSYTAAWAKNYPQSAWLLQEEAQAWAKTAWTVAMQDTVAATAS